MLVDGLARRGHKLTLLLPETEPLEESASTCQVRTWPIRRSGSHANWLRMAPQIARQVQQACRDQAFDLVYFTQARDALCFRSSKLSGPVLGGVHDDYFAQAPASPFAFRGDYVDWPQRWIYYRLVHSLERFTYRRLQGLIFNSHVTCHNVLRAFGLPAEPHLVCHYGIEPLSADTVSSTKEPILLFVGGNFERKGLPTLLRALPAILQHHPEYRLVVVGRYTNQNACVQLANDLGVGQQVTFTGYLENDAVQAWHQKAKLFIMPSLMEGFGIVYLEAMRSGTPVIATDVGGIPEVVNEGTNGVMVRPNQPEELAAACLRLLTDEALYKQLSQGATQTLEKFTPDSMITQTETFFERAVNHHRTG